MKKRDNAYKFADEFMKFMANSYDRRSDYTSIGYHCCPVKVPDDYYKV